MWAIRFLTGQMVGQEIPLQDGTYILGRSAECQIVVPDKGVSKKHLRMDVDGDMIFIEDLDTSNGTFINGTKIQSSEIQPGEKISLSQSTFDIVRINITPQLVHQTPGGIPVQHTAHTAHAPVGYPSPHQATPSLQAAPPTITLKHWFTNYMDKVVLPGVYKLPTWLELKWVIAIFLIAFVTIMTILSSIPLIRILNSSIEQESMNHAESIATTLAQMNYNSIKDQIYSSSSVEYALRRPGVKKAFIINATNGKILAPFEQAHTYSKIPFINEARRKNKISVKKLSSDTVAAMAPIQLFNSKTNTHSAIAYAAVIYNTETLAYGNSRVISLLVQTCFMALILGFILFFFLYKLIEYPIASINKQLNSALKDDTVNVHTNYQFQALQELSTNINSALSRISAAQETEQTIEYDRHNEMIHLIEMIGYPTLGISMNNKKVEGVSAHFEEETGVSSERILDVEVENIDDQALQLNMNNLIERVQQHPHEIATDNLEFSGTEFQLSAKGIYGDNQLSYILISFIPVQSQQQGEEVG